MVVVVDLLLTSTGYVDDHPVDGGVVVVVIVVVVAVVDAVSSRHF